MIAFGLTAILLIVSACAVVSARDALHSALWLILNLVGVAALYAQLEAHFLAAAQIIVYAGAIMVLVLFLLMLLNVKREEFRWRETLSIGLAVSISLLFIFIGVPVFLEGMGDSGQLSQLVSEPKMLLGGTKEVALLLFQKYTLTFELTGLLLTAALIGAVMLGSNSKGSAGSGTRKD